MVGAAAGPGARRRKDVARMTDHPEQDPRTRRRFRHDHKPKPLRIWVILLVAAVGVIVFLPRLLALLD